MNGIRLGLMVLVLLGGALAVSPSLPARPAVAASCSASAPGSSASPRAAVDAANRFGFHLFARLKTGGNDFLSPTSLALALDLAYDGARGATKTAMASVLGTGGISQPVLRQSAAALLKALPGSDQQLAGLAVANSLWARKGVPFRSAFLQLARSSYGAKVASLDFTRPSAAQTINRWVSCETNGKIPTIVDRIPPDVILYIINAIYFHGSWATPFNPSLTRPAPFTGVGAGQVSVPMMSRQGMFDYYADPDFQEISLPYADQRFSMVVLLPRSGLSVAKLRSRLNASAWTTWTSRLKLQAGSLSLPKFGFSRDYDMKPVLASMGMTPAFGDHADFLGMCVNPCKISSVRHKTFLSVDEKGTTAAAATSVGIAPTAVQPGGFKMVVDRPFVLAIRDAQTGSVLFLGSVTNPTG